MWTLAGVRINTIHTLCFIVTQIVSTIVDVDLTIGAFKACRAQTLVVAASVHTCRAIQTHRVRQRAPIDCDLALHTCNRHIVNI